MVTPFGWRGPNCGTFFILFCSFISSFTIHILISNLSSTLGANLDILEDCIVKHKINIVEEEIKTLQSLTPEHLFLY